MDFHAEAQVYDSILADFKRQSLSADELSNNELMVDSDDILLDAENEKDDLAIITPDHSDTDIEKQRPILANDRMFFLGETLAELTSADLQMIRSATSSSHL
jgi:hypothetical protein